MVKGFLPLRWVFGVVVVFQAAVCVQAAPPKPLVVVFPGGQVTGAGVTTTDSDNMAPPERSLAAARAVRDCFNMGGNLEAILYTPDTPLFLRAAQEARVELAKRADLTDSEQVAVSKAAGAMYLVQVAAQRASDGSGYEIRVIGNDLKGKKHTDRAGYIFNGTKKAPGEGVAALPSRGDKQALQNAIVSAANTLVVRMMEGQLKDYNVQNVVLPKVTPIAEMPLIDPREAEAESAALTQANAFLADGDDVAAITLLRRTINQNPLSAKARLALTKAYLASKRAPEAVGEAKRALLVADLSESVDRDALAASLAQAAQQSGDRGAARQAYEDIVAAQPDTMWPRIALANLLLADGNTDAAELLFRAVRDKEPGNTEASQGLIKIFGAKGDFNAALTTLAPPSETPEGKMARYQAAATLFDSAALPIADLLNQNRAAWEDKSLSREAFYRATVAQTQRASSLVTLLRSAPAPTSDAAATQTYNKRVLAASLLAQATTNLQTFLETGKADAGEQAKVLLTEFNKEMKSVSNP